MNLLEELFSKLVELIVYRNHILQVSEMKVSSMDQIYSKPIF